MKRTVSAAARVNVGRLRGNNEDNLYFNGLFLTEQTREQPADFECESEDAFQLYAVCDGMGGEQFGELAWLLSVETIHRYAAYLKGDPDVDADALIRRCINDANSSICAAQKRLGSKRIGATLALLLIDGKTANIYNIGDSRVYMLRNGEFGQLSQDHTSAANSVRLGLMSAEQAKTHPRRNSLTQYVGIDPAEMVIEPYHYTVKTKKRDIFLLCSDGLSDMVEEAEISRILYETSKPAEAARQLLDSALMNGGKDNVTVIVVLNEK